MGYDDSRKFDGVFGEVRIYIRDHSQEEARTSMRALDELAKGMRGNKAIPIYWQSTGGGYIVAIPSINQHGKDVLGDLGYDLRMIKLSRQQRMCAPWRKLKKQKKLI
jgi:hypothetical protein